MGHRPFPNAGRALRQVQRDRRTWILPAADAHPWLLSPDRIDVSTVRLPRVPEGWGERANENIRSVFSGLTRGRS